MTLDERKLMDEMSRSILMTRAEIGLRSGFSKDKTTRILNALASRGLVAREGIWQGDAVPQGVAYSRTRAPHACGLRLQFFPTEFLQTWLSYVLIFANSIASGARASNYQYWMRNVPLSEMSSMELWG